MKKNNWVKIFFIIISRDDETNQAESVYDCHQQCKQNPKCKRFYYVRDPSAVANTLSTINEIAQDSRNRGNSVSDLTGTSTNEAKTVADAINANSGVHGANADAFNNVSSVQKGTFNMGATFTINGDTVELATSYAGLVSNINQSVSGINAELNGDNTITLSNTTGSAIVIAGSSASDVGFTAGTYTGFVSLTNIDGSAVKIEAGSEKNGYSNGLGTIADLAALGFNEISDGKTIETDTVSGTALSANDKAIGRVIPVASTDITNCLRLIMLLVSRDDCSLIYLSIFLSFIFPPH